MLPPAVDSLLTDEALGSTPRPFEDHPFRVVRGSGFPRI